MSSNFGRATAKITIASLEKGFTGEAFAVKAQYNPKELQIDRTVPWSPTGEANKGSGDSQAKNNAGINLEFTGAQGRTLSIELLFDGYEQKAGDGFKVDVTKEISKLERFASVKKPGDKKEDERRPHQCIVNWGTTLQSFKCVIESMSTKYTMFDDSGKPLRATCTVKLKEADSVSTKKPEKAAPPAGGGGTSGGGTSGGS